MKEFLKKNKEPLIAIIITFIIQMIVYKGSQLINVHLKAYDLTIPQIDNAIPFIPFFIIIYVTCYIWWYLGPIVIFHKNRSVFYNYIVASVIGFIIHLIIYLLLPTTITRAPINSNDIFSSLVQFIYNMDGKDNPLNLFPSMHCFISTVMVLALIDSKEVKQWYRISSYIYGALVCLSTVFVKQHYSIDIVGGVLLGIICYYIVKKIKLGIKLGDKIHDNKTIQ